jgi:hypothetical protein
MTARQLRDFAIAFLALMTLCLLMLVTFVLLQRENVDPLDYTQTLKAIYATNSAVFEFAEGTKAARTATAQASPPGQ